MYVPAALHLLHRLGEDCIPPGIGEVDDVDDIPNNDEAVPDEVDDDVARFRKANNRKARQSKESARDVDHRLSLVTALWSGEALETLNHKLQHAESTDGMGKVVLDATYARGPVFEAQRELFRRATSSHACFSLSALVYHYEPEAAEGGFDIIDFERDAFARIVEVGAQLDIRVAKIMAHPPFSIAQLQDCRSAPELRASTRDSIRNGPRCCLDPACTAFVHDVVLAQETDAEADAVITEYSETVLKAFTKFCLGTNMGCLDRI